MKERPIIMTGESVRAIIEGRKTMTRRVMKVQPTSCGEGFLRPLLTSCPYGWKQERLWVRETWAQGVGHLFTFKADWGTKGFPSSESAKAVLWHSPMYMPRMASRLTLEITDVRVERVQGISEADVVAEGIAKVEGIKGANWNPGTFGYSGMGRGTYHIRKPKYERYCHCIEGKKFRLQPPQCAYRELWDSVNGKRGYGWDKNPWVWAITFKVVP